MFGIFVGSFAVTQGGEEGVLDTIPLKYSGVGLPWFKINIGMGDQWKDGESL